MNFMFTVSAEVQADLEAYRLAFGVPTPKYLTVAAMLTAFLSEAIASRVSIDSVVAVDAQIAALRAQRDSVISSGIVAFVPPESWPVDPLGPVEES